MTNQTQTPEISPVQSFLEKRREAALKAVAEQSHTRTILRDLVIRGSGQATRFAVNRIIEVAAGEKLGDVLTSGSYVVEIVDYVPSGEATSLFATVQDGTDDRVRFDSMDMALLHLIARRNGSADDRGTAAEYAARVLDLPLGN